MFTHDVTGSGDLFTNLPYPNPCFALGSHLYRQWSPHSETDCVFSLFLKLSALSDGSQRSSGSTFQAIGPATENARRPCCDNVVVRRDGGRSKSVGFVLYCIMHTLFLLLGLGSVLGLELGFSVKAVMVEVIWLHFISGPVT